MKRLALFLIIPALLLAACGGGKEAASPDEIATIVAATLEAAQAATPTDAPDTTPGAISGTLSYPSEAIPALTVVAYDLNSDQWYFVNTDFGQDTFQIDNVPPGSYQVVAYVAAQEIAGGYTAAVPCGLSVDCNDHSLIAVDVRAGQTTAGIQPHDWYAPKDAFPANPVMPDEGGNAGGVGSITGALSYGSNFIPPMNVVAFDVNSSAWFYVVTELNQQSYQIDGLPAGTYYVVAYPVDSPVNGGGYSAAVPCGLSIDCTDHSLLPVTVVGGETTEGVNPQDFYADPGTYPASPVQ